MKGRQSFRISKVDTDIYVKGFSGVLVYKAVYTLLTAFGGFTVIYLLTSPFWAVLMTIPYLLVVLTRLNKIQKKVGSDGYQKLKIAQKLPHFLSIRFRIGSLVEKTKLKDKKF